MLNGRMYDRGSITKYRLASVAWGWYYVARRAGLWDVGVLSPMVAGDDREFQDILPLGMSP